MQDTKSLKVLSEEEQLAIVDNADSCGFTGCPPVGQLCPMCGRQGTAAMGEGAMNNPEVEDRRYTQEVVLKSLGQTTIKLTARKLKGMQRRNAIGQPPYSLRQLSIAFMLDHAPLKALLETQKTDEG